jgi:hypothetical protein
VSCPGTVRLATPDFGLFWNLIPFFLLFCICWFFHGVLDKENFFKRNKKAVVIFRAPSYINLHQNGLCSAWKIPSSQSATATATYQPAGQSANLSNELHGVRVRNVTAANSLENCKLRACPSWPVYVHEVVVWYSWNSCTC